MPDGVIRIIVADDHPVVREGLSAVLGREADFEIVALAADGQEALDLAGELRPDVVLMDLKMPRMDGVEAIRRITASCPETSVLVLTTFDSEEDIFRAMEAGARGYLLKDEPRDELFRAVRAVARHESPMSSRANIRLFERLRRLTRHPGHEDVISGRELEVLRCMARGAANREIAAELVISESTVKTHVSNIFQKLGANDRTQAVTMALQRNLISLEEPAER